MHILGNAQHRHVYRIKLPLTLNTTWFLYNVLQKRGIICPAFLFSVILINPCLPNLQFFFILPNFIPMPQLEPLQNTVLTNKNALPLSCLWKKWPLLVLDDSKLILNDFVITETHSKSIWYSSEPSAGTAHFLQGQYSEVALVHTLWLLKYT